MVFSESQIMDVIRSYSKAQCLLANQTALEQRVASAIFRQWPKWIDASAHDAPPPDYFSDKLHMMFDVLTVYDSETEIPGRPGKVRNPILEEERRGERFARELLAEMGIDASNLNIFYDCEKDGTVYDTVHTYCNYQSMVNRVIKKHTDKISLYCSNHPNYMCGLFVYDCTEAYIEVSGLFDASTKCRCIPHYPWLDRSFVEPILETELNFLIWAMPFKKYSDKPDTIDYPISVIMDLRYPKLKKKLVNYASYLMRPL